MLNLYCDVLFQDRVVGRIDVVNGVLLRNDCYTDCILEHPCPNSHTLDSLLLVLKDRVISPDRFTPDIARYLGLFEYDWFEIFKKTHGVDIDDFFWFRFDGEFLSWDDVRVR